MDILNIAIQAEGSSAKLARKLGITPARLSNWKARGIPDGWASALRTKYAKQIKQQQSAPIPLSVSVS